MTKGYHNQSGSSLDKVVEDSVEGMADSYDLVRGWEDGDSLTRTTFDSTQLNHKYTMNYHA